MPQPAPKTDPVDASKWAFSTWSFLEEEMAQLNMPLLGPVQPFVQFRDQANQRPTPFADRIRNIEQAKLLFDHLYPHLPFKLEMFKLGHPCVFLEDLRSVANEAPEHIFQAGMIAAFSRVRDAHTNYGAPPPWRGAIAFLPFQMRTLLDSKPPVRNRYFVTRVMKRRNDIYGGAGPFGPGAEIVGWGRRTIESHVLRVAEYLPGCNRASAHARGALAASLRPLTSVHPPFDDELPVAEVHYIAEGEAEVRSILLPWGVASFSAVAEIPGSTFSVSSIEEECARGLVVQCRERAWEERRAAASTDERAVSHIPEIFEFQFTGGPQPDYPIDINILADPNGGRRYGYLRIKAFRTTKQEGDMVNLIVEEARRILTLLDREAPDGLVLDIRGNPGGDIKAGERILQMLTSVVIEPELFHYANTRTIQSALQRVRDGNGSEAAVLEFGPSASDAGRTPREKSKAKQNRLTTGVPITNPGEANAIGQVYHGPVTLLTDAFTYSAADIFAAGFQDHAIGFAIGADQFTGGGGANVFTHSDLVDKFASDLDISLAPLPTGVTMRVAFRRCSRTGVFGKGKPIEDLGVQVNEVYTLRTVDDVIAEFPGMVKEAVRLMSLRPKSSLQIEGVQRTGDEFVIEFSAQNVGRFQILFDGVLALDGTLQAGGKRVSRVAPPTDKPDPFTVRIEGYVPLEGQRRHVRVAVAEFQLRQRPVEDDDQSIILNQTLS